MNYVDIAIAIILAVSTAIGVWRGFVREAMSLLTWLTATATSWSLAEPVSALLSATITDDNMRRVAAFLIIFMTVYIVGTIASTIAHRMFTKRPMLKLWNTLLGAGLGGIRAVVIIVVAMLLAGLVPAIPASDGWKASKFVSYFEGVALYSRDWLPGDIARYIRYD